MVNRSQQPVQIMETQTRFDLNVAIDNWRQELAAQANLTPEVLRELETHLRDTIRGLQQCALNDQETFWLARRRIGQPQRLGEEFEKADPSAVWRGRVFWMVLGCLVCSLWQNLVSCIQLHHWLDNGYLGLLSAYSHVLLYYLPPIIVAIILARRQLNHGYPMLAVFFRSRLLFATSAIFFIIVTQGVQLLLEYRYLLQTSHGHLARTLDAFWANTFSIMSWPLMLVMLVTWLMPPQNRKTLKSA